MDQSSLLSPEELVALDLAVELAGRGDGTVLPNPVVGCVLLDPAGVVVGVGFHEMAGGPHAEVMALRAAGSRARGATAVVTLEPCNHTGRTGPCSVALTRAGVDRVVVAVVDPWPAAAGGMDTLRAAGVEVVDVSGTGAGLASEQVNRVWLTAVRRRRPFVTLKTGQTVDGRVAAADGTSRWITSTESRADAHLLRSKVDTMMVGIGTVLADDPQLTARDAAGAATGRQPLRVVVDSAGRTPPGARVRGDAARTLIATGAEFPGADGRVDLPALLDELYRRGRRHVLLEGGPTLAAAMLAAELVDEVLVYQAPLLLGDGLSAITGGVGTLADAHRLSLRDVTQLGPDLRIRYAVERAADRF